MTADHGADDEPTTFAHAIPAAKVDDQQVADLAGPLWRPALVRLYLDAGMYMPLVAKRYGASFGWCDHSGVQVPRAEATHFGWTAGAE